MGLRLGLVPHKAGTVHKHQKDGSREKRTTSSAAQVSGEVCILRCSAQPSMHGAPAAWLTSCLSHANSHLRKGRSAPPAPKMTPLRQRPAPCTANLESRYGRTMACSQITMINIVAVKVACRGISEVGRLSSSYDCCKQVRLTWQWPEYGTNVLSSGKPQEGGSMCVQACITGQLNKAFCVAQDACTPGSRAIAPQTGSCHLRASRRGQLRPRQAQPAARCCCSGAAAPVHDRFKSPYMSKRYAGRYGRRNRQGFQLALCCR